MEVNSDSRDNIVEKCKSGIFPKLSFLIEERDGQSIANFFKTPSETFAKSDESESTSSTTVTTLPASHSKRTKILSELLEVLRPDGNSEWWTSLSSKSRAYVLIFISENYDGSKVWCSQSCSALVADICQEICARVQSERGSGENLNSEVDSNDSRPTLKQWFVKNFNDSLTPNETDFHAIIKVEKSKFNQTDWKYYPASAHGFGWILQQVPHPYLGNHMDMTIPPTLLFTDDYYDDNKLLGLKCLVHIVKNTDKNDLIRNNKASVIFHAVQRLLTDKDPEVIHALILILLKVLEILEKDPSKFASEFTRYDDLLKQILYQMEFSSDQNLKRTWLPILDEFMNRLGTATFHWSDRICGILLDYTTCNDHVMWMDILKATETLIKTTWLKPDFESIAEIILRIVFNASSFHAVSLSDEIKLNLVQKSVVCLQLLRKCDGSEKLSSQLNEIVEKGDVSLLHPNFISAVKSHMIV